jgi:glycosyltransferase involved in cell wall biosynthesis
VKILMLLTNPFRPDPRPLKEAGALVEAGNEVTILAWDRETRFPKEEKVHGIKVSRIAWRGSYGRGVAQIPGFAYFWLRVLWRLLTWDYDVVHCHDLDTLPLGWLMGRLRRKRVVFDSHIPFPDRVARREQSSRATRILVRVLEMVERTLAKRADILLTDSEKMVERFRGMGVKKGFEILNVPPADFGNVVKERHGDTVIIGRIGLMSRDMGHGVDDTLDAFERLVGEGYDVRLALLGNVTPDSYKEEVSARIQRLGDRVTFSDFIPYSEVIEWYGKLDISVILYDMRIHRCMYLLGYPTKLFESMAAGIPIVLRSNDHAQQLLLDNECGLVVGYDLDSIVGALRELVENPELRARYGANGRRMFEQRYNWAVESQRLVKAYGELLGNSSAERG